MVNSESILQTLQFCGVKANSHAPGTESHNKVLAQAKRGGERQRVRLLAKGPIFFSVAVVNPLTFLALIGETFAQRQFQIVIGRTVCGARRVPLTPFLLTRQSLDIIKNL